MQLSKRDQISAIERAAIARPAAPSRIDPIRAAMARIRAEDPKPIREQPTIARLLVGLLPIPSLG